MKSLKNTIKYIFFDVDGTLTDGSIYMSSDGELFKRFNIKDGYAIKNILPKYGIVPVFITSRYSKIVQKRAVELGVKFVFQGVKNKESAIVDFLKKQKSNPSLAAYVGDDIPDGKAMLKCAFRACPSDAIFEIKMTSNYVSKCKGGYGAVRDIIEYIINH